MPALPSCQCPQNLSLMLNEIVPVPQKNALRNMQKKIFFLHFRNSLSVFCSLSTLRLLLAFLNRDFFLFRCRVSLMFIHQFPLKWLSFEYWRRSRQRSHWNISLRCAKLNRIPRKEIFVCALYRGFGGRHGYMETPKMPFYARRPFTVVFGCCQEPKKSEIYLRLTVALPPLSHVFVCTRLSDDRRRGFINVLLLPKNQPL